MRRLLIVFASAICMGSGWAQDNTGSAGTGTATGSSNNAVNPQGNMTSNVNVSGTVTVISPSALEQGSNSFTEGQARARIEGAGFSGLNDLHKDQHGIWRGKATRDGKPVDVGFDYKGNIGVP